MESLLFLSQIETRKKAGPQMRRGGKSRLWKTAGFSIALGESLMTSRPTLIQSLRLDCSNSTLPWPPGRSLTLSWANPPFKKATCTHTPTHCPPPNYPKPSVLLENYRRFSLRGWPERHCCFHSLPWDPASKHLSSNEDFETTAVFFLELLSVWLHPAWF